MQRLKLLSLLKKLSGAELEGFHKHLRKYHPREKIGLCVLEYLMRFHPRFDQPEKLQLTYAYPKIFKSDLEQDANGRKKLLNTASDLYGWLQHYLIVSKLQQNHDLQQMIWLSILQERGMVEEFSRKADRFYEETLGKPFKSPSDALPNWMACYFQREKLSLNNPLAHTEIIQHCTDTMTDCQEIIRLRMACEISLINKVMEQKPVQPTRNAVETQQNGLALLKNIYMTLWQLTETSNPLYFEQLEYLLIQNGHEMDVQELDWIIRYAYNFAAHQSRQNPDVSHSLRMHRLNKISLTQGVFTRNGSLPPSAFGNVVTIACQARDFDWASSFIQQYSHVVPENKRRDAILLAKAVIAFESGKYQIAVQMLEPAVFEAELDVFRSKSILLRSYYELNTDQYLILETCARLENLLRRSRKSEASAAMLAFVLILKRIVAQKSSKKLILERIHKSRLIYSKNWLLEKTATYIPKFSMRYRDSKAG